MPEWSIGPVSKSGVCHRTEGSNPSLSLKRKGTPCGFLFVSIRDTPNPRRGLDKRPRNEVKRGRLGLRPRAVTWKAKAEHREVFVQSLSRRDESTRRATMNGVILLSNPPLLHPRREIFIPHKKDDRALPDAHKKKNRFTVRRLPKTPGKSGISRGSSRQSRGFRGTKSRASRGSRGFSTSALPARCRRRAFPSRIRAEASCTPA